MRRLLMLVIVIGLLFAAFVYLRPGGIQQAKQDLPGSLGEVKGSLGEVKDQIANVGEKLKETKTSGSVKAALELNRDLQPYSFDVDTAANGGVVLKGEVPREDLRALAARVASGVPGVDRLDNQVRVNPALPAPAPGSDRTVGENFDDKAIEAKVSLAFSLQKDLKGTNLSVKSFKRAVALTGEVDTAAQKRLAADTARQTTGVGDVTDQVAVRGQAAPAGAPAQSVDPNAQARNAENAVRANASLASYGLTVIAENGRPVLRGQVRTTAEKDLAGALAREAAGAAVENFIDLKP